jgi:hypothetical protein
MDQKKNQNQGRAEKPVGTKIRKQREAEALRANLARRKVQTHQRKTDSTDEKDGD